MAAKYATGLSKGPPEISAHRPVNKVKRHAPAWQPLRFIPLRKNHKKEKTETPNREIVHVVRDRNPFLDPLVWATLAIFLATCATAAVAYFQWQTLQETNHLTAIEQRPYITSADIRINARSLLKHYWTIDVVVQNSGGTPTRDMRFIALKSFFPPDDPANSFRNPPSLTQVYRGLVGPNATVPLTTSESGFPESSVRKWAEDRVMFFVYGIIYYKGQSPNSEQYVTKYCFDVHPTIRDGKLSAWTNPCIHWNCMDDDCETDRCIYQARATEDDYTKAERMCSRASATP